MPRHGSPDVDVARRRHIPENQLRDATPTRIGMVRTLASSTPSRRETRQTRVPRQGDPTH
ncbi:hypothetical protein GFS60_06702 (plasmid) [Rhodococcus sp. WAY2]|nr:hypothetical protein GFS60_06702 [Rhodococcus sp. WAY2]